MKLVNLIEHRRRALAGARLSAGSVANYTVLFAHLEPIKDRDVRGLTASAIVRQLQERQRPGPALAQNTTRLLLTLMGSLLRWSVLNVPLLESEASLLESLRRRLRESTPREVVQSPKLPTLAELQTFLAACQTMHDGLQHIVWLMFLTGLRADETLSLQRECLTETSGGAWILSVGNGLSRSKTGGRQLPMPAPSVEAFRLALPLIRALKRDGRRGYMALAKQMARVSRQTGIKIRPHDLRRMAATIRADAGMDLLAIKSLLGHRKVETTLRYIGQNPVRFASVEGALVNRVCQQIKEKNSPPP